MDDMLKAIGDPARRVLIDGHEGRKTLELVTAIYEASITGRPVTLPITKDSMLYTRDGILANALRFPLGS